VGGHLITNAATAVIPLVLRGVSGQSAVLQSWQNSAGTALLQVSSSGNLGVFNGVGINSADGNAAGNITTSAEATTSNKILIQSSRGAGGTIIGTSAAALTSAVLSVRAAATQTGNIQEWQNSGGTVLSRIDQNGSISVPFLGSTVANSTYLQTNADTQSIAIFAGAAASKGLVVRGFASQTANLQEWQNSAGSILSRVLSDGSIFSPSFTTTNGRVAVGENTNGGTVRFERATGAQTNPGANFARLYFRDGTNAGTLKLVVRAGAAGAETTILDNIPQ
jgi:hypothetical protein